MTFELFWEPFKNMMGILFPTFSVMAIYYMQRKQNRKDKERDEQFAKAQKEQDERIALANAESEHRTQSRRKESLLVLKMLRALGQLSHANTLAIKNGHTNGELTEAVACYKLADNELFKFLKDEATDNYTRT